MLYRKIKKNIVNWIHFGKDALLIAGARQVGKSFIIRETLKEEKQDFVEINFIKEPKLAKIFKDAIDNDFERFQLQLNVIANRTLNEGTIIFFDEVQECKDILTVIKFLVEAGKFKYILSGSLLGVELTDLKSAPVGYLTSINMYPMDLEEFYIANGLSTEVLKTLEQGFKNITPIDDLIHQKLIESFYRYLIVGGMPEAVNEFIESKDLKKVSNIHKKIITEYKRDFTKYELNKKLKLLKTYELIPAELNSHNKKYKFTSLDPHFKYDRYENSFNWLIDAGVAIPTYNCTEFQIPLQASKKSNMFKLFLSDVGLLTTLYGPSTILKLLDLGKDINCGSIFENFVAMELNCHGFKPYYFNNKKHGEVDFLIEYDGSLLPIWVKSGKDYKTHSALSYFMTTKYFEKAFVFSNFNVKQEGSIVYYPIYMCMFLLNELKLSTNKNIKIDLSSL